MKIICTALAICFALPVYAQTSFEQDFAEFCRDSITSLGNDLDLFDDSKGSKKVEVARRISKSLNRNLRVLQIIRPKADSYKRLARLEKVQSGYEDMRNGFAEIGGLNFNIDGDHLNNAEVIKRLASGSLMRKMESASLLVGEGCGGK